MTIRLVFFTILICLLTTICPAQDISKINFDRSDTLSGYYLAIPPHSKNIKAVVVLLTSFMAPEQVLSETKLHNVAFINDMLVVVVPMKQKIYADSITVSRLAFILEDVVKRYSADTSRFVLAGYDEAGNIALRFTEHTVQYPSVYKVHPKVVFGIDTPVDLISLWHWSERQIKKNFWPGAVGDARYYLDMMKKEIGPIDSNAARYKELTPFHRQMETGGNEKYLRAIAVRLYYDTDIEWQLKYRRNSYYDTKMPDASELVNRLLLMGNKNAAYISVKASGGKKQRCKTSELIFDSG